MAQNKDNEKINKLEEKIKELQARKQKMIAQEKAKERDARTKRLVEYGAIFESYFQIEDKKEAVKIAKTFSKSVKENKQKINETKLTEEEKKKHKLED